MFFKLIQASNIKSKDIILQHYYRNASKELKSSEREQFFRNLNSRYREFNFVSEQDLKGFEWRSLNCCGVKTWGEFEEFINIVYKCVYYLCKKATSYNLTLKKQYNLLNQDDKNDINYNIKEYKKPKEIVIQDEKLRNSEVILFKDELNNQDIITKKPRLNNRIIIIKEINFEFNEEQY